MKKARPGEGGGPSKAKDNKGSNSLSTARVTPARLRPHFLVLLRPEPGVDGTRALRRFLKTALRSFRLRCIRAEEVRP